MNHFPHLILAGSKGNGTASSLSDFIEYFSISRWGTFQEELHCFQTNILLWATWGQRCCTVVRIKSRISDFSFFLTKRLIFLQIDGSYCFVCRPEPAHNLNIYIFTWIYIYIYFFQTFAWSKYGFRADKAWRGVLHWSFPSRVWPDFQSCSDQKWLCQLRPFCPGSLFPLVMQSNIRLWRLQMYYIGFFCFLFNTLCTVIYFILILMFFF